MKIRRLLYVKRIVYCLSSFIISIIFLCDVVDAETYKRGIFKQASTLYEIPGVKYLKSVDDGWITPKDPEAVEIIGEEGDYYNIRLMWNGFQYTGYIPKSRMDAKEYTLDETYRQNLIAQGFPADYARKLTILHAIHPNWVFTPSYTGKVQGGLDFTYAVNREMVPVHNNLIDHNVNISLRSTEDGAYSNGVYNTFSGGWYAASRQAVAFYMDPRNFLDESHIFMFENQAINLSIDYRPLVVKSLAGTFMADGKYFTCLPGQNNNCTVGNHTFVDTFVEVGTITKQNPVHLASRVKQEQGNGSSALASGVGINGLYVGYYNFFNIQANGKTQAEVVTNGLAYAANAKRNWNNPYASILGGAQVIGTEYIYRGQSNNYYQKFDTIQPTYSHQYMQNIQAPYNEAWYTYLANYASFATQEEWDNHTYEFLIPIYQNMGSSTSLDSRYNSDATLRSLSIPECKFTMDFNSSATEYDCYVEKKVTMLNVNAETTNSFAKVEYFDKVNLTADESTVTIKVTASDGSIKNYTVKVHRVDKSMESPLEVLNKAGYKVSGEYMSNIAFQSDVSNIINSVRITTPFAEIKIYDIDGKEITAGMVKSGQIVTVTNGDATVSFKTVIYGDINSDNKIDILDLLLIQKHILNSKSLSGVSGVSADLNWDGKIDILDLLVIQKYILGAGTISQG